MQRKSKARASKTAPIRRLICEFVHIKYKEVFSCQTWICLSYLDGVFIKECIYFSSTLNKHDIGEDIFKDVHKFNGGHFGNSTIAESIYETYWSV